MGPTTRREFGEITNHVELIASDEIDDDTAMAIGEVSAASNGRLRSKFQDKRRLLWLISAAPARHVQRRSVWGDRHIRHRAALGEARRGA